MQAEIADTMSDAQWSTWTRRIVSLSLLAVLVTILFLLGPFFPALLLAAVLVMILLVPVRALVRRTRLSYRAAVALTLLCYVVLLGGLIYLLLAPVTETLAGLISNLGVLITDIMAFLVQYTPNQGWFTDSEGHRLFDFNFILEPLSRLAKGQDLWLLTAQPVTEFMQWILDFFLGAFGSLGSFLLNSLFVHLLAIYALLELPEAFRWLVNVLPSGLRRETMLLALHSGRVVSGYGRGLLLNTLISGIAAAIMLLLLGVSDAIIIALFATVFLMIPIVGGYIAGALILLSALLMPQNPFNLPSVVYALLVYLAYTVLQGGVIATLIEPRIYGSAVALPVTLILLGISVAGFYAGFLGMVLIVPILGVAREVVIYAARKVRGIDPYPDEPEPAFVTQSRLVYGAPQKSELG